MDRIERLFTAMAAAGFFSLVAVVIWMWLD